MENKTTENTLKTYDFMIPVMGTAYISIDAKTEEEARELLRFHDFDNEDIDGDFDLDAADIDDVREVA